MPKKIVFEPATEIKVTGIIGFLKRKVTAYGTGAKVTCPKEYLGKTVYLVITNEPWEPTEESADEGSEQP
jgi:putative transposon-encoded protein